MFKKNWKKSQDRDDEPIIEAGNVVNLKKLANNRKHTPKPKRRLNKAVKSFFGHRIYQNFIKKDKTNKIVKFVLRVVKGFSKKRSSKIIPKAKFLSFTCFKIFTSFVRIFKSGRWFSLFFIRFFWILTSRIVKFSFKNTWKGFQRLFYTFKWQNQKKKATFLFFNKSKIFSLNQILNINSFLKNKRKNFYTHICQVLIKGGTSVKEGLKPKKKKAPSKTSIEKQLEKSKILEEAGKYKRQLTKSILSFIVLAFLLVVPFKALTYYKSLKIEKIKNNIIHSTQAASTNLKQASASIASLELEEANQKFNQANTNFVKAKENIQDINVIILKLAKFIPKKEAKLASVGEHIINAGRHGSKLGDHLTLAFNSILKADSDKLIPSINDFHKYGDKAIKDTTNLRQSLAKIDKDDLVSDYGDQLTTLKEKTKELNKLLKEAVNISEKSKILLGAEQDKKYLLVFQNNNELRATGGFIGSYALLEVDRGEVRKIEVPEGGSYDVEAGMTKFVRSPKPLHLVDPLWHFWDGNWWPDWPTSAKNLMDLYENSGGQTVDGVISFTPTVLQRILTVTGPIKLEQEYKLTIDSQNCEEILRNTIEKEAGHLINSQSKKPQDTTNPKKIIGILMNKIIKKIGDDFNKKMLVDIMMVTNKNLKEKHILFYFKDKKLQQQVEQKGWSGKIKESKRDYLSVINTNIAGQKSDKKIKQNIFHQANIQEDGTIIDKIRIERIHTGEKNTAYYGARNVNWMRIYVPEDSRLLNIKGFDGRPDEVYFEDSLDSWQKHPILTKQNKLLKIHKSGTKVYNTEVYKGRNKTVFGNWSILNPGETKVIELEYELPFKLKKQNNNQDLAVNIFGFEHKRETELYPYSIYIQKQSGTKPNSVKIKSKLTVPEKYSFVWKYPEELNWQDHTGSWQTKLNNDKYWAVLFKK